ncbi:phage gp6-like head-tail connector protein [Enterococcus faecalis]|nr:phage gp6-like head-tail connector protein [Enterococcus faecalis]
MGNAVNSESEGFKEDELFINATILLTQYWYLNRGEAIAHHIPVYVTSMIQQYGGNNNEVMRIYLIDSTCIF